MNKFPIPYVVTSFADLNSLAVGLQNGTFIILSSDNQNCNYQLQLKINNKKKKRPTDNTISELTFEMQTLQIYEKKKKGILDLH